jgi:hypothetical protein
MELKEARKEILAYQSYVERDSEQDIREKQLSERELAIERKATALAEKERDLYKDQASYYKAAYDALKKKPGFGCTLKKVFTLGIARCT